MKNERSEIQPEPKLEDDLNLLKMIIKSKSDIKSGNLTSQQDVKRRLGYKENKWKENA